MPFAIQNPVAENLNRDRRTDIGDLAFHRQNDMVILLQQTGDREIGLLRRQGSPASSPETETSVLMTCPLTRLSAVTPFSVCSLPS